MKLAALALGLLAASCAASDDNTPKTATTSSPPQPQSATIDATSAQAPAPASVTVSSVVLAQDCPDPAPVTTKESSAPAGGGRSQAEASRSRSARGFTQGCTQSYLHLAFREQGPEPSRFQIKSVRLATDKEQNIVPLVTRSPSLWQDNLYKVWDETIAGGTDLDASYKLSIPNWSDVESKIGGRSHGLMFHVEVDVEIDGAVSTLRSPAFERTEPMNVRT